MISFLASIIGGICGIGGGIIIKPALDLSGLASIATISFLSSCTVLSMSAYNVCKSLSEKSGAIDTKSGTPLAIGAALGGVGGGIVGKAVSRRMDNKAVDKLFIVLMCVIICICIYNAAKYL